MRWYLPIITALAILLASCSTDTSTCPPLVEYTPDEMHQAAHELDEMAGGGLYPMVRRFIGDYKAERAQIRACF